VQTNLKRWMTSVHVIGMNFNRQGQGLGQVQEELSLALGWSSAGEFLNQIPVLPRLPTEPLVPLPKDAPTPVSSDGELFEGQGSDLDLSPTHRPVAHEDARPEFSSLLNSSALQLCK
jgi:hypothetical protein